MNHVREGLAALRAGRAPGRELLQGLGRIAQAAAAGTGIGRDVEAADLVGELLQRVWEGDLGAADWEAMSDGEASGLLFRRLRQIAVELSPGWNGYRALRAMVARALEEGLPDAPASMPLAIYESDRLCARQVALAVAWVQRDEGGEVPAASQVAKLLARLYMPSVVPLAPANDDSEVFDDDGVEAGRLDDQLDAERLRRGMAAADPEALVLLQRRAQGDSLESIARDQDAGVATVHRRVGQARQRIAAFIRDHGFSPASVRLCLDAPVLAG